MAQSFDPVFGEWYTEKQLGSGTDGKAYTITRTAPDGSTERAVLKTIRVGDYRSEKKSFNKINGDEFSSQDNDISHEKIISNITENIDIIQKTDNGRHFVRYDEWEKRKTSDSKGTLILIRLEEMKSLSDLLENFSFTLEETMRLGISICRSLIRCRDFGYIYPNLKPENILFDRRGVCKLGDFGSFSCLEPTKTSIAYKRTQYFMAPEFLKTGKINCTIDTYSLGLVLYMLVNRGRLPFTENYPAEVTVSSLDNSKLNRLSGTDFPKPALCDELLFMIIKKACAFKPEERYLSPKQMLADLENALNNKPLEETHFEDIYSVSDPSMVTDEEVIVPKDEPISDIRPETVRKPVSLKEEIQIPDISPIEYGISDNNKPAGNVKKRRAVPAKLPEMKRKKKTPELIPKKFLILLIVAVCLFILFIVSLKLRLAGDEATIVSQQAAVILTNLQGSEFLWHMI